MQSPEAPARCLTCQLFLQNICKDRESQMKNRLNVRQSWTVAQLNLRIYTSGLLVVFRKRKTSPLIVLNSSLTASIARGQVRQKRRADERVLPGYIVILGSRSCLIWILKCPLLNGFNDCAHSLMVPLPPVKKSMRVTMSCSTV